MLVFAYLFRFKFGFQFILLRPFRFSDLISIKTFQTLFVFYKTITCLFGFKTQKRDVTQMTRYKFPITNSILDYEITQNEILD